MTQKQAMTILKMGKNVFLTGAAGSGKTYVLNKYIKYLKQNDIKVAITASTGIAATHMNGKTIHSWARIGVKDMLSQSDLTNIFNKKDQRLAITEAKVLIIDEVSMLHHFRLDMVDAVLRKMHGKDEPFGGIQVVLCGDLFQLPPVTRGEQVRYINESAAWDEMDIHICYLTEQYRHEDDDLKNLLNEMRDGEISELSLEKLSRRKNAKLSLDFEPTKLYTHNYDVDKINDAQLKKLNTKPHKFNMSTKGDKALSAGLAKNCLAPEELELKTGALVMFVQNNYAKGYVNGTLGTVVDFDLDGMPIVETLKGKKIIAALGSWRIEDGERVLAEINQIPLRLAWAITVHKSQGMTLDAAQIDLSKSFVLGMGYVALSRVKRLDSLNILGINNRALLVDPLVIEIDKLLRKDSIHLQKQLSKIDNEEIESLHSDYIKSLNYSGALFN